MWNLSKPRDYKSAAFVNLGFLIMLLGICGMVSGNSGFVVILVFGIVFFLFAIYQAWQGEKARARSASSRTQQNEEGYPDLNETFTYQTSRPAETPSRRVSYSYPNLGRVVQPLPAPEPPPTTEVRGHTIYQHAQDAIEAANRIIDKVQPLPVDVGLLVYRGDEKPAIYRTLDVPTDADHIQPYVQLHVPLPLLESGTGRVRFEIIENDTNTVFNHEQAYTLKDRLNLITPPARLPVTSRDKTDMWELRVSLGDTLLARHYFIWGEMVTGAVIGTLGTDGELSHEVRNMLEEQYAAQPLSLDDLLAGDGDSEMLDDDSQQGSLKGLS